MKYKLEVGARTVDDVLTAEAGGADRVELYSSPLEGALTPSAGFIKTASLAVKKMKLFAMIRPRAGDFLYSHSEFQTMQRDVETAVENGADGVMFGILKDNGRLDTKRMKDLISRSGNKKISLHRAFDFSSDPMCSLNEAIELGCDYILTIGQAQEATFSRHILYKVLEAGRGKINIMLGLEAGFNTQKELPKILEETGALEYHVVNGYRCRKSAMTWTGKSKGKDDFLKNTMFSIDYLSEQAVRDVRDILDEYESKEG
ncbi:MAG: copper homeostasis protein CutC [Victivallales bacterium]|nr:copper homeostasis protein CutC [Victivallales bacterium]